MLDLIPPLVAQVTLVIIITYVAKKLLIKDKDGFIVVPIIKADLPIKELIVYIPFVLSFVVAVFSNLNVIFQFGDFISKVTNDTAVIISSTLASYALVVEKIEKFIKGLIKKDGNNYDVQG